jgi:hypothetical protein
MDQIKNILNESKLENAHLLSAVVLVISLVWFFRPNRERAVNIAVPEPLQCQPSWKGEILESPKIKV